jgi:hypothetical protein
MALPTTNTTCDIYRYTNGPPSAPDVAGVACFFAPKGRSTLTTISYTHVLLVPATTDIRDNYNPGTLSWGGTSDKVYLPDKNSAAQYRVVLVRRVGLGTSLDHKEVLLVRQSANWPTNDV